RVHKVTPEGMLIKMLMVQNNLTVKEVSRRIGKTDATVCDVISGKNRSRKTLNLIMDAVQEGGNAVNLAEYRHFISAQLNRGNTVTDSAGGNTGVVSTTRYESGEQEEDSLVVVG
ncbi:MAG: hypothetical protein LUC83_10125, partial [Clostridiales bacterium]|nr:hypothetical protein [Clostridiales bacterium]